MKKLFCLSMAALAVLTFFGAPAAYASGINITIPDTVTFGSSGTWCNQSTFAGEDREVKQNCVTTQSWDLEAFVLKNNTLCISGEFDFKNWIADSGAPGGIWNIGGLFIANTEKPKYGTANTGSSPGDGYGVIRVNCICYQERMGSWRRILPGGNFRTTRHRRGRRWS